MVTFTKQVLVDWDNSGTPSAVDPYEDVTADLRQEVPIRMRTGRDQVRELSPPAAGFAAFVLDNQSRRYSDDYVSSPIYGKVLPGRRVSASLTYAKPGGAGQTVINDAPYVYWALNEATGATLANDYSGSSRSGTISAGVTMQQPTPHAYRLDGTIGTSAAFNGSSGYVGRTDTGLPTGSANRTFEAWVYITASPSTEGFIGGYGNFGTAQQAWYLGYDTSRRLFFSQWGSTVQSATVLALNTWYHVAVVTSGNNVTIYVNAAVDTTGTATINTVLAGAYQVGQAPGAYGGTTRVLTGRIDDPAIYPSALSAARILAHYNAALDQANSDTASTAYSLFSGFLQDPDEHPMRGDKNVHLTAYDGLGRFHAITVETAMYASITTDQAIGYILDSMGWPAGKRTLDTGATTLDRWWASGKSGFDAIRELILTEGPPATAYVDGSGTFHFESRHYRYMTGRCTSSQATIRDTITEPCYSRYDPRRSADSIINTVLLKIRAYTTSAGQPLTRGGPSLPLAIPVGGSATWTFTTTADAFNTAAATVVYSSGTATASWDRTSGKIAHLTLTSSAGCVVSSVSATGTLYTIATQEVANSIDASASIAAYGIRTLKSDFQPLWVPTSEGVSHADYVVSRYMDKVPQNTLALNSYHAARMIQAAERVISDRVTLVESTTGASADYFVEQIERQIQPGGVFEAALGCERATVFWALGVVSHSELGQTTRLGL